MRDERLLAGFLLFHLLVALPGLALLYALGFVRPRAGQVAAAAGPAFVTGMVVLGVPLTALVVLGAPIGTAMLLLVLAAVTAALGLAALRTHRRGAAPEPAEEGEPPPRTEVIVERVLMGAVALYLLLGGLAFTHVPTMWDDANIWSLKGLGLYYHDGLVEGLGRNRQLSGVHLDYPILQPLLEASFFRAIGAVDLRLWHLELWVVFGAVLWTLAWLLASLGRRWLWVLVLASLAVSGTFIAGVTGGGADTTMAGLLACGALCLGIWLDGGRRQHAVLGAVFIAGALNVKNEGLAFTVAVAAALVLAVLAGRVRGRWGDLAVSGGIVLAATLPWQLWVATNSAATRSTPSPWEVIGDPGYLGDRLDYLWRGIEQIATQFTAAQWGLLIPALLVVGVALILLRRHRTVAGFYLMAWLLASLAVAYTYWVTPIADLGGFEERSGPRIVLGVVFAAAAGLAHLVHLTTRVATSEEA